jgi:hypothetical protein
VRGKRATKKICASTLSLKGTDGSSARRRLTDVDPTSGAVSMATIASAPNTATDTSSRARTDRVTAPDPR